MMLAPSDHSLAAAGPTKRPMRAISLLFLACIGCRSHRAPAHEAAAEQLTLEALPRIMDKRAIPLLVSWQTSSGQRRPVFEPRSVSVQPPELATVYEGKELRCRTNGNGVVRVRVATQEVSATLRCFLTYQLLRSGPLRLVLGSPPVPSGIDAARSGGAVDESVAVTVTSDAPEVVSVDGNLLLPKKLGRAQITGTAQGPLEKTWPFEVVALIGYWQVVAPVEPISVELEPGKYELSLHNTEDERLTVKWSNFPQCNYSARATAPVITCSPDRGTRMTVYPPRKEQPVVDYLELIQLPP